MTNTAAVIATLPESVSYFHAVFKWLGDTSSQTIGAATGAFLAYLFGYKLLRMQLVHIEKHEKKKLNEERYKKVYMFFEDTEEHRKCLNSAISVAIHTCEQKKKQFMENIQSYSDVIHLKYLSNREYFNDDEIMTFRLMHRITRDYAAIAENYNSYLDNSGKNEIEYIQFWGSLEIILKRMKETLDKINTYDPMTDSIDWSKQRP